MKDVRHQLALLGIQASGMCRSLAEGEFDYEWDDENKPPRFLYQPKANQQFVRRVAKIIEHLIAAKAAGGVEEVNFLIDCLSLSDSVAIRKLSETEEAERAYVEPIRLFAPVAVRRKLDESGHQILDADGRPQFETSSFISPIPADFGKRKGKKLAAEADKAIAEDVEAGAKRIEAVARWVDNHAANEGGDLQKARDRTRATLRRYHVQLK